MKEIKLQMPEKLAKLFEEEARYRGAYGGRGSGKSWAFADMLLLRSLQQPTRVLCVREIQNSIRDSVLRLLTDRVEALGLQDYFDYGESFFRCTLHNEDFIFKGLRHNYKEIKSTEGVDICWIEEAEAVSDESYRVLLPTVLRRGGSEVWLTWNPELEDSPTNNRFRVHPPEDARIVEVNWRDNPWFPEGLNQERLGDMKRDPDLYQHVWEGDFLSRSDAQVLAGKWRVENFTVPDGAEGPFFGCDWGFASDPTVLTRSWIHRNKLYIDRETGGKGIEVRDLADTFDTIAGIRSNIIRADNARPELISHMQTEGFKCVAAGKWAGSIADGISYLRSFDEIIIHERCPETAREAKLYSYKTDRLTGNILPQVLDANNHYIDSIRYALDHLIRKPSFTGRPVFPQFSGKLHVSREEYWPVKKLPIIAGVVTDGRGRSGAIVAQIKDQCVRVIDEIFEDETSVAECSESLKRLLALKYKGCPLTVVVPYSAAKENSIMAILLESFPMAEPVRIDSFDKVTETVRQMLTKLHRTRPLLSVSPTCEQLIGGLAGGYQFSQLKMQGSDVIRYSSIPEMNQFVLPCTALQLVCAFFCEDNTGVDEAPPVAEVSYV